MSHEKNCAIVADYIKYPGTKVFGRSSLEQNLSEGSSEAFEDDIVTNLDGCLCSFPIFRAAAGSSMVEAYTGLLWYYHEQLDVSSNLGYEYHK